MRPFKTKTTKNI